MVVFDTNIKRSSELKKYLINLLELLVILSALMISDPFWQLAVITFLTICWIKRYLLLIHIIFGSHCGLSMEHIWLAYATTHE
ncbi:hypothetical protein [Shewanella waksmanii]|uniref:hypothetical protein n=1 Tax=Shewanella waksmanii TaxID=213783 RepID=UPI0037356BF5